MAGGGGLGVILEDRCRISAASGQAEGLILLLWFHTQTQTHMTYYSPRSLRTSFPAVYPQIYEETLRTCSRLYFYYVWA